MNLEEAALHSLIFIILLVIGTLVIQVWRYLDSKSTGHQTLLDEVAKDGILVFYLTIVINWLSWIKIGDNYNYYIALVLVKISQCSQVLTMGQAVIFNVVRYQYVFHFEHINSVDEKKYRIISQTLSTTVAVICGFIEDRSKTYKMLNLIHSSIDDEMYHFTPITSVIFRLITIAIIVFLQIRIVVYKRKLPSGDEENQDINPKYIAPACLFAIIHVSVLTVSFFVKMKINGELTRLATVYFDFVVIIVILLYGNKNMSLFVKRTFRKNSSRIAPIHDNEIGHVVNMSTIVVPNVLQFINEPNSSIRRGIPLQPKENIPQISIINPSTYDEANSN